MLDFLTAPYPLKKSPASDRLFIFGTGAFVAFFLIVFQPFGTREFQHAYKYWFLAGYGIVISLTIFLAVAVLPRMLKPFFNEEKWTVGRHILYLAFAFSLVFLSCYVYKDLMLGNPVSWRGFLGFYPVALSVAVFPITGMVLGDYIVQLKRFSRGAENVNQHFSHKKKDEPATDFGLSDENGKEVLRLAPSQLLYLQAADNYVEVYYQEEGKVQRTLIRNTLSVMESALEPAGLFRCHRSYLVNCNLVVRVSGNAQGYRLHFEGAEQSVPVARGRSAEVLERLQGS